MTPRRILITLLAILLFALAYQVLADPVVGLADSWDYYRIMGQFGLSHLPETSQPYFAYLQLKYRIDPADAWKQTFIASELVFPWLAVGLNKLLSKDGLFDLRVMGFVHAAFYALALGLLLGWLRRLGRWLLLVLGGLAVLIFSDVGYVQYLNSFYSEPACLVFLFLTLFTALRLADGAASRTLRVCKQHRGLMLVLLGLFSLGLLLAKPQNSILWLALAPLVLRLGWSARPPGSLRQRWLAVALALLIAAAGLFQMLAGSTENFRRANLFHSVFQGALTGSADPAADLAELGVANPQNFARYAGKSYYDQPVDEMAEFDTDFYARTGFEQVALFYLRHPDRLAEVASRASQQANLLRVPGHANFARSSGLPPTSQSSAFALWSRFKEKLPSSTRYLALFFALNLLAAAGLRWRLGRMHHPLARLPEIHLALLGMAALQLGISLLGDGLRDLVKHLLLFNALNDLSLLFMAGYALAGIQSIARRIIHPESLKNT